MNTTDWNYDFSSLPRWDNRETWMAYDVFHEIPQNDVLCCIYSITEVRMGDYRGFLAILKGKDSPSLLLHTADNFNFCDNFSVSEDGNLIFLMPHLYDESCGIMSPILIIDLQENCFSYIVTNNINPLYKIVQKSEHVFEVEAFESQRGDERLMAIHGMKIKPDQLQWHDLQNLDSLPEMVKKEIQPKYETVAPPAPKNNSKIVLGITAIVLALLIGLLGLVQFIMNAQKDTEEYQLAYSYLIASDAFQQMNAEESDIRVNQYSTKGNFSRQTVEIGFIVNYKAFTVICHKEDGKWVVCEECTLFD